MTLRHILRSPVPVFNSSLGWENISFSHNDKNQSPVALVVKPDRNWASHPLIFGGRAAGAPTVYIIL
jgi:hypothetical protein